MVFVSAYRKKSISGIVQYNIIYSVKRFQIFNSPKQSEQFIYLYLMSHQAGVSITKLQFDKSPNIIMGGERNGPTQLEAIPQLLYRALRKCTLTLTATVYLKNFAQRYIFAEISIISRRKILWYNPFD